MSRLNDLVDSIVALGTDHSDDAPAPQNRSEAKEQIKALFLELIGEDEPDGCTCTGSDCGDYLRPAVANGLRDELRAKIEKL